MAGVSSPLHALRPVFLAGAAAFAWMTFSSSPASADLLPEPSPPAVNEISVSAPSADLLAQAVNAATVAEPAAPVNTGEDAAAVVEPAAPVSAVANGALDAVDTVDQVSAPPVAGFIEATEPVIEPVLASIEPALDPVKPVLAPVLAPAIKPATELVTALEPVVGLAPAAPLQAVTEILPEDAGPAPSAIPPLAAGTPARQPAPARATPAQPLNAPGPALLAAAASAGPVSAVYAALAGTAENAPAPPSSPPPPVPAAPGSGGGSAGGAPPGAAAWLSAAPLVFPLLGAASAPEFVLHAPEPVSFDPGSSPD